VLASERHRQLFVHDLHDLLGGRQTLQDFFRQRSGPNAVHQVVGDLHRDIRLEQCGADIGECVVHLLGVELASLAELREDAIQALGQYVEHSERWVAVLGPLDHLVYRPRGSGWAPYEATMMRDSWSSAWSCCAGSSPRSERSRLGSRSAIGPATPPSCCPSASPSSSG